MAELKPGMLAEMIAGVRGAVQELDEIAIQLHKPKDLQRREELIADAQRAATRLTGAAEELSGQLRNVT
jgi:hypothetical protein